MWEEDRAPIPWEEAVMAFRCIPKMQLEKKAAHSCKERCYFGSALSGRDEERLAVANIEDANSNCCSLEPKQG